MKLVELYSLTAGQKIDRIHTIEKYFPLSIDKYIIIQPWSKPSKNYDYWDEVISLIKPILDKENIKIVQVGAKDEKPLNHCHHLMGQTNWGQLEYVVSKSELVLSADSVSSHLAGHFDKNLVVLISNNFKETVSPYFGSKNKQIILEPDRTSKNPSFTLDEGPNKQINEIKPEDIAKSVLQLLNLEFSYPFKTLFIGPNYPNKIIESANDFLLNISNLGIQNLVVRNDYNYNLNNLFAQLQHCKCSVVTSKEIPIEPLLQLRPNVLEILIEITEESNPKYPKILFDNKIPFRLYSKLPDERLNPLKLSYLDLPHIIFKKDNSMPTELKDRDLNNVFYKSSKITAGRGGKLYFSKLDYLQDRPISNFDSPPIPLVDINIEDELLIDKENLYFLEKV